MTRASLRRLAVAGLGCALLIVSGCETVEDEELFGDIGTLRIFFVDSQLRSQGFVDPDGTLQVAQWKISKATVDLDGEQLDLLIDPECTYFSTAATSPRALGRCAQGLVVGASETPRDLTVDLAFEMTVRRATPVPLQPNGDSDGDGVLDDGDLSGSVVDNPCRSGETHGCDDNCLLLGDPTQRDLNGDGVGSVCSITDPLFGDTLIDSDGDGVGDSRDNCFWVPNPGQENTSGVALLGIPDGIGDACNEQVAQVRIGGSPSVEIQLSSEFTLPVRGVGVLTVDFANEDALDCDWDAGICTLELSQVDVCVNADLFTASFGCPIFP